MNPKQKAKRRRKRDPLDAYLAFVEAMQLSAIRRAHERMRPRLRAILATPKLVPAGSRRAPRSKKRKRGGS